MNTTATTYTIRVEGHLDDHWSDWLGGLNMTRDDDGATTITVEVADQAQLHGYIGRFEELGLELLSVEQMRDTLTSADERGKSDR